MEYKHTEDYSVINSVELRNSPPAKHITQQNEFHARSPHTPASVPTPHSGSPNVSSNANGIREGVYISDALDLMASLPRHSFDLMLTGIPYAHMSRPSSGLRNLDKGYE